MRTGGTAAMVGALLLLGLSCDDDDALEDSAGVEPGPERGALPATSRTPREELRGELEQTDDFETAVDVAGGLMRDTVEHLNGGAIELAHWGSEHFEWDQLRVPDETNPGLVMRDPDQERGKRTCHAGRIVSIRRSHFAEGNDIWEGEFMSRDGDVLHFLAVQSVGDLVQGSEARICGVATGRFSFDNIGGGQTQAVQIVGMFRTPENAPDQAHEAQAGSQRQRGTAAPPQHNDGHWCALRGELRPGVLGQRAPVCFITQTGCETSGLGVCEHWPEAFCVRVSGARACAPTNRECEVLRSTATVRGYPVGICQRQ